MSDIEKSVTSALVSLEKGCDKQILFDYICRQNILNR